MIFVTVGTHEQGFDRLIKEVDNIAEKTNEHIIVQKGYTKYDPKHCSSYDLISNDKMNKYMQDADLIITHGGPSTYMAALSAGKQVIVVPRLSQFNEHVNDHQLEFAQKINEVSDYNLTIVTDIHELETAIQQKLNNPYKTDLVSNTHKFNTMFQNILERYL